MEERQVLDIFNRDARLGDLTAYVSSYGRDIYIGVVMNIEFTRKTHTITIDDENFRGNNFIILRRETGEEFFKAESISGLHTEYGAGDEDGDANEDEYAYNESVDYKECHAEGIEQLKKI